jgi:hypothetical protein
LERDPRCPYQPAPPADAPVARRAAPTPRPPPPTTRPEDTEAGAAGTPSAAEALDGRCSAGASAPPVRGTGALAGPPPYTAAMPSRSLQRRTHRRLWAKRAERPGGGAPASDNNGSPGVTHVASTCVTHVPSLYTRQFRQMPGIATFCGSTPGNRESRHPLMRFSAEGSTLSNRSPRLSRTSLHDSDSGLPGNEPVYSHHGCLGCYPFCHETGFRPKLCADHGLRHSPVMQPFRRSSAFGSPPSARKARGCHLSGTDSDVPRTILPRYYDSQDLVCWLRVFRLSEDLNLGVTRGSASPISRSSAACRILFGVG